MTVIRDRAAPARAARVDPATDPRWLELAEGPGGSLFTSPPWIAAVCETYGFTPEARIIEDHGGVRGGFAWVRVHDLRGERLVSLPFSDRAEPFAPDLPAWRAVAADALAPGAPPITVRCLAGSPALADPRLRAVGEAAWHATSLDGGPEAVRTRMSPEARRNLRAAARRGLRFVAARDLDSVRAVHRLHVALRKRKYRLLAPPVALFERIWERFAPEDRLLAVLARDGDEVVAGALYLVWGDVLYYKFGASLASHLDRRPNEGVAWTAIGWGAERGLGILDWGLSDLDQPGLLRFKRKWGAAEGRIVTVRGGGEPRPGAPGAAEMLGELTRLLTDDAVPEEIAARAGAILYRNFC